MPEEKSYDRFPPHLWESEHTDEWRDHAEIAAEDARDIAAQDEE